jgi:uncharacterized damage-inducible protein DinB
MSSAMMEDLIRHKWHANAAVLGAIYESPAASRDEELRKLLHHIVFSNRFWLFLALGREFDREQEAAVSETLDPLIEKYKETEALEMEWLSRCNEAELNRELVTPRLPGRTFTVAQAILQTITHSHGHRAQSAIRMRSLGGTPPQTDFIVWAMNRPGPPVWPTMTVA